MKSASAPLIALMDGGRDFVMADLWTITLSGGATLRYSGADKAISWSGQAYRLGPILQRSQISEKIRLEVATLTLTITAGANDQINGVPLLQFIKNRGLDGANIRLERAFMPDWNAPVTGTIIRFAGRVKAVEEIAGNAARLSIASWASLLNVKMPADLYQAACRNALYDTRCGLTKTSFGASSTVSGSPTRMSFASGLSATHDDYALGTVTFTSGPNSGISRTIRGNVGGSFTLVRPLPAAPGVGNAFTVYPGCNRTSARCSARFNNLARFRGEEFVPQPETAL